MFLIPGAVGGIQCTSASSSAARVNPTRRAQVAATGPPPRPHRGARDARSAFPTARTPRDLSRARLADKAVALVVKRAVGAVGLDPTQYAGYSLGAGLSRREPCHAALSLRASHTEANFINVASWVVACPGLRASHTWKPGRPISTGSCGMPRIAGLPHP